MSSETSEPRPRFKNFSQPLGYLSWDKADLGFEYRARNRRKRIFKKFHFPCKVFWVRYDILCVQKDVTIYSKLLHPLITYLHFYQNQYHLCFPSMDCRQQKYFLIYLDNSIDFIPFMCYNKMPLKKPPAKERGRMTDNQKLDLILRELGKFEAALPIIEKIDAILPKVERIDSIESDMQAMKNDIRAMESGMQAMKNDMQAMEEKIQQLDCRVVSTQMHLENVTDRNIQLIAENFINLTTKLDEAVPAADKSLAYEVKVNYLIEEVQKLKQNMEELKAKIA